LEEGLPLDLFELAGEDFPVVPFYSEVEGAFEPPLGAAPALPAEPVDPVAAWLPASLELALSFEESLPPQAESPNAEAATNTASAAACFPCQPITCT